MITKDRLLAGMNEMIYVEEGMVTFLANFSKGLLKQAEGIEEEAKKEIEKLLSRLYRDSSRHEEIICNIVKKIERSPKSGY